MKIKSSEIDMILEAFVNRSKSQVQNKKIVTEGQVFQLDTSKYGSDIYDVQGGLSYNKESYKDFLVRCHRS